jgi:FMN phosphatase YigB (HAD superfamily)
MDKKMQGIKNIIFDLGGVLIGLDGQRCIDAFEAIGAHEISNYVRLHRTEDLFMEAEIGKINQQEFCCEVRKLTHCKATDSAIVAAWCCLLDKMPLFKLQKMITLRANYRLLLLSNTNDMHWNYFETQNFPYEGNSVKDIFEKVYLSYEMHLAKPSEEIFEAVIEDANVKAEETLFIDDSSENCKSAENLGLHTFLNTGLNDWVDKL